ncbi:MAG: hypothetical protein ACRCXC_04195 [Legionella sp.]
MKLYIFPSTACPLDHPDLKRFKNYSYVFISCKEDGLLRNLEDEFGYISHNYAFSYKDVSPRLYADSPKTGSGKYQVPVYVFPYLVDQNDNFTIKNDGRIGGMFVHKRSIDAVKAYLATVSNLTVSEPRQMAAEVFAQVIFRADGFLFLNQNSRINQRRTHNDFLKWHYVYH